MMIKLGKDKEIGVIIIDKTELRKLFKKWVKILRIENNWDVLLELVDDEVFKKTGDFKIDCDDKKAVLLLNCRNPHRLNLEEVIVHELLHLKLYPLDQITEGLIEAHYEENTGKHNFVYTQFMLSLEQTVEELAKCFLGYFGENKEYSYGRCKNKKGFNELYAGLKAIK